MLKNLRTAGCLVAGIGLSQMVATVLVYRSNARMHARLTEIDRHGYMAVPNRHVLDTLTEFTAAFNGGLFYSMTVGVCLTLAAYVAARSCSNASGTNALSRMVCFSAWMGTLLLLNINGFLPLVTLMFLLVPLVVFILSVKCHRSPRPDAEATGGFNFVWRIGPMCVLALVFVGFVRSSSQPDTLFLNIRDRLLLNHSTGLALNDFYYTNSLYSADVFKSDAQKLLKTAKWIETDDPRKTGAVNSRILLHDYLPMEGGPDTNTGADMELILNHGRLQLMRAGRAYVDAQADEFLKDPAPHIQAFSEKTDRYRHFRDLTFMSILISGAVMLYLILFMPFRFLGGLFFKPHVANLISCIAGLALGIGVLALLSRDPVAGIDDPDIQSMLASGHSGSRLRAIQYLVHHERDIATCIPRIPSMDGFHAAERYWLAKALSFSRSPETGELLFRLTQDSRFNVVCMAARSLGLRRDLPRKRVLDRLLELVRTSDHWYVQWYAYRALKRMGWKQTVSTENP